MNKEITTFSDIEIKKRKFYYSKDSVDKKNVVIDKVAISNQASFCKKDFKYFIGFKNDKKVKLLCITLPKRNQYVKSSDETKCTSLLIKNDKLLKKYNKTLNEVSNSVEKGSDGEQMYNEQYLKVKTKSYEGKTNTSFHNAGMPKEGEK